MRLPRLRLPIDKNGLKSWRGDEQTKEARTDNPEAGGPNFFGKLEQYRRPAGIICKNQLQGDKFGYFIA